MTAQCETAPGPVLRGPVLAVLQGQDQDADQTRATADQVSRGMRSWPLLLLAVPAAAEVWSGWVGIAKMTGFGLVSPLPGIWSSLHLDTTVTLPVGVEAYAAIALRAWLTTGPWLSARTRRFAKRSAICSLVLGMAGQVAYHLLAQAGQTRAPWIITTIVSCLPVLVLAMGTTLAHMLRDDATASLAHAPVPEPGQPRSPAGPLPDQTACRTAAATDHLAPAGPGPWSGTRSTSRPDRISNAAPAAPGSGIGQARRVAAELAASGKPVSRRALREAGVRGSNEALNALARALKTDARLSAAPG
jgi:hypothetical protein